VHDETNAAAGERGAYFTMGDTLIEMAMPTDPGSRMARHVAEHGSMLYRFTFVVRDLASVERYARSAQHRYRQMWGDHRARPRPHLRRGVRVHGAGNRRVTERTRRSRRMTSIMRGVRVLEVAGWTFVPSAGAILSDWGADVLKVEHPETGDPQRGLATLGVLPGGGTSVSFMMQGPNRGKRSVAINIATDEGREVLYRLVETSDVFLTSYLPSVRERLRIDVDDIRARNEKIIYVRGHGQGAKGPERDKGGFDGASYWARGGVADTLTTPGSDQLVSARPGIGDVMGGLALVGGISAALFHRAQTGAATVVDASLLNTAMWQLQTDIAMTSQFGLDDIVRFQGGKVVNPLVGNYRTKDDRFIFLNIMQSDRFWADFCQHLGRVDLIDDPRFCDASARAENSEPCQKAIADTFASRSHSEWRKALATMAGVWAPVQRVPELPSDVQVIANGYLCRVTDEGGSELNLVGAPAQFDEQPHELRAAPEHGQHTDEVLEELGLTWDEVIALKVSGAVL